jgi:hypothetical protein
MLLRVLANRGSDVLVPVSRPLFEIRKMQA